MNTDELEHDGPSPPLIAPKDKWAWYVWEQWSNESLPSWHRTCWEAESIGEAIKLRELPGYHTQFHSGKPQKLVRERLSFCPADDVIDTRVGSYNKWTNGVPNSFGWMGVGFGYRVNWVEGYRGWVISFRDEYTAVVRLYRPDDQAKMNGGTYPEPNDVTIHLDEFVAKMPETLKWFIPRFP